jgi:hypothetical protein
MPPIDLHTLRWEAQVFTVTVRQIHDGEPLPPMLMREHVDRGLTLAAAVPDLLAEIDALRARIAQMNENRSTPKETKNP